MARVVAVFDDLLLGSNVLGMLRAAGHEAQLAGAADPQVDGADVVIVDLASGGFDGVALVERLRAEGVRVVSGPRRTGDGYYEAVIEDPDGNLVEVTA